jgi:erythromycin esterase
MAGTGPLADAAVFPLSIEVAAGQEDLAPLARLIDDGVRAVAIGESVHAAHEFYALRHRLIRFLVERLNFTALAWETGFPEACIVNAYIQGQALDRERALMDGMTMHMGRCEEMGALVDWLRDSNASRAGKAKGRGIRFYGLDFPGAEIPLAPALEVVLPYVESVDLGFQPRLDRLRELAGLNKPRPAPQGSEGKLVFTGAAAVRHYSALSVTERDEQTARLADLSARFDAMQRLYIERSDTERYELARQHLRVAARLDLQLRAVVALMAGDAAACEGNIRDATMADTLEWILEREERVIILAHNGHIQRTPIATPTGSVSGVDTLGVHLARRLGEQYLTIGTTCGSGAMIAMRAVPGADGSPDSELYLRDLPPAADDAIDRILDQGLTATSLVDLRSLGPQSAALVAAARRMRMQDQQMEINVRQAFDLLIHVPRITPWTSSVNASMPDERENRGSR